MASERILILYDFPSTFYGKAWNPTTFQTRFILNFKGIKYRTEWVEYPDIESKSKQLGVRPTGQRDGKPLYTLPAIKDVNGTALADSMEIARYLDKTYPSPSYPIAVPRGTEVFHANFERIFKASFPPSVFLVAAQLCSHLNPRSERYFRRTREKMFGGVRLEDLAPPGSEKRVACWKAVNEGWDAVAGMLEAQAGGFLTGSSPVFADFMILSRLVVMRMGLGEDSEEWKRLIARNGGRWGAFMRRSERYTVVN